MCSAVQALCNEVFRDNPPRRMVNGGLDWKRFDQVLAVLIKHGRMKLYNQDARVNVLGGAPAMEPAADAAMAAAIISSFYDVQMPSDIAFVGEVDLGGALWSWYTCTCVCVQFLCAIPVTTAKGACST